MKDIRESEKKRHTVCAIVIKATKARPLISTNTHRTSLFVVVVVVAHVELV